MNWRNSLKVRRVVRRFSSDVAVNSKAINEQRIPGPKYYPFLGPLNEFFTMGKAEKLHLTMDDYHRKYGPIVHIKLGGIDSVFLSTADYMRSIFSHEGKYPKHILPPAWIYFNQKHNLERGLLFMDDEEWFKHRQIMNNFLLRDYRWIEDLIQTTCDNFVSKLKHATNVGGEVAMENLERELYLWSSYSIINLMLGSSIHEQSDNGFDEKVLKLVTNFGQIMKNSAKLMSIPPQFADKFNLRIWKDFEENAQETLELTRSLISTLSNEMEISDNGLLKKMKLQNFSEDVIVRLFSDLLIAAGDTTVNTVQWYLYKIAKDTELQIKLKKSVADNPSDVESPLVRGGLRETLRLYPVATFVARVLDSDATVGNYRIPKGWLALTSFYTSGRDPDNFTNPSLFAPERWLRGDNKTENKVLKTYGTMPFAIGGRSCVGKKVATYQIHCLISKILQNFSLKSLNEDEVNFKLELVGVPDRKILIAFRHAIPCDGAKSSMN